MQMTSGVAGTVLFLLVSSTPSATLCRCFHSSTMSPCRNITRNVCSFGNQVCHQLFSRRGGFGHCFVFLGGAFLYWVSIAVDLNVQSSRKSHARESARILKRVLIKISMRLSIIRVNWEICCWPAGDRCEHAYLSHCSALCPRGFALPFALSPCLWFAPSHPPRGSWGAFVSR